MASEHKLRGPVVMAMVCIVVTCTHVSFLTIRYSQKGKTNFCYAQPSTSFAISLLQLPRLISEVVIF